MTEHHYHDREASKRMADWIALHQAVLSRDEILRCRFVAIRLSDGGSDGTVYDSRPDAMRHQLDANRCAYVQIPLARWGPQTCDSLLFYARRAYDAGYRPDPEHQLIIPTRIED